MNDPLFSIIVPMYNVERYLPECVESISAQTLRDIEIILVDDGSPDRCGEMAEQYARADERIRVVHRRNGGLGSARNSGLEVARGEYIGFVDSDDWVEPEMYEKLYEAASHTAAQIVFAGMKVVGNGKVVQKYEHPYAGKTLRGPREIFQVRRSFYGAQAKRIAEDPVPVSACVAGYNRLFIEEHSLRFRDIRSEDKFFNTEACRIADSVACIAGTPYCYRKDNQPSITKSFRRNTIDSFSNLFCELEKLADEEPDEFWDEAHERVSRCIIDYSRVLIGMIEESSIGEDDKRRYVRSACDNPALAEACKGFPFWKLPVRQALFCLCLRLGLSSTARLLTKLRKKSL